MRIKILAVILALLLIGLVLLWALPNPARVCEGLPPGITRQELIAKLGSPIRAEQRPEGERLYFHAGLFAAGPIRAVIDSSGRVAMLRCCEDCP